MAAGGAPSAPADKEAAGATTAEEPRARPSEQPAAPTTARAKRTARSHTHTHTQTDTRPNTHRRRDADAHTRRDRLKASLRVKARLR